MNEMQVYDPRRAGLVNRYHAQIHVSNQSVAEHTWQVLRILTTVWPEVPSHVMKYVVFHDIAEGVTGDIPYPVKLADLKLKRLLDTAETSAVSEMTKLWELPGLEEPSSEERTIVKACELVEMWEWALYEQNLGNRYAGLVADRLLPRIEGTVFKDQALQSRYFGYVKRRKDYELGYQQDAK